MSPAIHVRIEIVRGLYNRRGEESITRLRNRLQLWCCCHYRECRNPLAGKQNDLRDWHGSLLKSFAMNNPADFALQVIIPARSVFSEVIGPFVLFNL